MEFLLQVLAVAGLIVSASALVFIANSIDQIRSHLRDLAKLFQRDFGGTSHHHFTRLPPVPFPGYAIFVYRQGRWELESDLSAPGHVPSPPTLRGAYEGQVIKKESWLSSSH